MSTDGWSQTAGGVHPMSGGGYPPSGPGGAYPPPEQGGQGGYPQPGYPPPPGYPPSGYPPPPGYPPSGYPPPGYGSPPQPPRPSRRGLWVGLGVLAVLAVAGVALAVGMSGDDGSTLPPEGLTVDELRTALLTAGDVGGGYTESTDATDEGEDDAPDIQGSPECEELNERFAEDPGGEEVAVEFERENDLASVSHELQLVDERGPRVADLREAAELCPSYSVSDEQGETQISLVAEEVEGIGDEALALRVSFEITGTDFQASGETYGIFFTRGGVAAAVVGQGGLELPEDQSQTTFEGLPADEGLVHQLAQDADGRIQELLAAES